MHCNGEQRGRAHEKRRVSDGRHTGVDTSKLVVREEKSQAFERSGGGGLERGWRGDGEAARGPFTHAPRFLNMALRTSCPLRASCIWRPMIGIADGPNPLLDPKAR